MEPNVLEQFCQISGLKKDMDRVRGIIERQCPDYLRSFDSVMDRYGSVSVQYDDLQQREV